MYDSNKMWKVQTIETLDESNPEIRKAKTFVAINVVKENTFILIQCGSWSKIIRVRFVSEDLLQSQSKKIERGDQA